MPDPPRSSPILVLCRLLSLTSLLTHTATFRCRRIRLLLAPVTMPFFSLYEYEGVSVPCLATEPACLPAVKRPRSGSGCAAGRRMICPCACLHIPWCGWVESGAPCFFFFACHAPSCMLTKESETPYAPARPARPPSPMWCGKASHAHLQTPDFIALALCNGVWLT